MRVAHHRHGAHLEACEVGDDELEAVGQLEHDARAVADFPLEQRAGQPAVECSQLAEREPSIAVDDGASVTIGGDDRLERVGDGNALPDAARSVSCRHVLRPANDSFHTRHASKRINFRGAQDRSDIVVS